MVSLSECKQRGDINVSPTWFVSAVRPAAEVLGTVCDEAERQLRGRFSELVKWDFARISARLGYRASALGLRPVAGRPHGSGFRRVRKLPPFTTPLTHTVAHRTVGAVDQPVMGAIISYEFV